MALNIKITKRLVESITKQITSESYLRNYKTERGTISRKLSAVGLKASSRRVYYVPFGQDRIYLEDKTTYMSVVGFENSVLFPLLGLTYREILEHLGIDTIEDDGSWPYLSREDMVVFCKFMYNLMDETFGTTKAIKIGGEVWL